GITRGRLLLRQSRIEDARQWLNALNSVDSNRDTRYRGALCLLSAGVDVKLGRASEAARWLMAAEEQGITTSHEFQGQYYFELSELLVDGQHLCKQLRGRALRIWNTQGQVLPRLEAGTSHVDVELARQEIRGAWRQTPEARSRECVADAVAATFDVAHNPRL